MRHLKIQDRHEKATSPKGKERVREILQAARDILIEEGYPSLTMRKIAASCGMTVGNLSYYFPNKQALLHDLTEAVVEGYAEDWDEIRANPDLSPEEQFTEIVHFILADLGTKETTRFFPALWVLANHDPVAAESMEYIYAKERKMLAELIGAINPALSSKAQTVIALFVSSTIEGHTMFTGFERKWTKYAEEAYGLAVRSLISLIKNSTTEEVLNINKATPYRHPPIT